MTQIEMLAKQMDVLLSLQENIMVSCTERFEKLMATVETQVQKGNSTSSSDAADTIREILETRVGNLLELVKDDVCQLEAQLEMVQKVQEMPQDAKRTEVETLLLKDIEELEAMDVFNERVEKEVAEEKKAFFDMISDIEDVLAEGGVPELEALLEETTFDLQEGDEESDDSCCDDAGDCCSLESGSEKVAEVLQDLKQATNFVEGKSSDEPKENQAS